MYLLTSIGGKPISGLPQRMAFIAAGDVQKGRRYVKGLASIEVGMMPWTAALVADILFVGDLQDRQQGSTFNSPFAVSAWTIAEGCFKQSVCRGTLSGLSLSISHSWIWWTRPFRVAYHSSTVKTRPSTRPSRVAYHKDMNISGTPSMRSSPDYERFLQLVACSILKDVGIWFFMLYLAMTYVAIYDCREVLEYNVVFQVRRPNSL